LRPLSDDFSDSFNAKFVHKGKKKGRGGVRPRPSPILERPS
jgi:hypothetical protein